MNIFLSGDNWQLVECLQLFWVFTQKSSWDDLSAQNIDWLMLFDWFIDSSRSTFIRHWGSLGIESDTCLLHAGVFGQFSVATSYYYTVSIPIVFVRRPLSRNLLCPQFFFHLVVLTYESGRCLPTTGRCSQRKVKVFFLPLETLSLIRILQLPISILCPDCIDIPPAHKHDTFWSLWKANCILKCNWDYVPNVLACTNLIIVSVIYAAVRGTWTTPCWPRG
jgi:hypothetical protein